MRKFLILLLLAFPCLASEPKFHYMDCVKVIQGFYEGCTGNVISYNTYSDKTDSTYTVSVDECNGNDANGLVQDFKEDELKGCRK